MRRRQLRIPLMLWRRLHRQLRHRGGGMRESGAFLLGDRTRRGVDRVRRFVCYDDLDPNCLAKGYIEFCAPGFSRLWAECRRWDMDVLGDVHTHPGGSCQSETDRMHPMISEAGHVGVIIPSYAGGSAFRFGDVSVYEYLGDYRWLNWSGSHRRYRLRFTWW
ncbi:MAG: hypothetical protein CMJ58_00295 [Planctomycetaceae bacterium]|nr:hypothetical protein [Planctomycetaceae bacterium]